MIITTAKPQDALALFALEMDTFEPWNAPLSKRSFRYHIAKNLLLVAKNDEKILGYALVLTSSKCPRLYSLAVSKEAARQGIGTALLKEVFTRISRPCLRLEVRQDNTHAIRLYEKLGFSIVGQKKAYYDDGCDAFIMKWK